MGSLTNTFKAFGKEQLTTFDYDFDIADVFGIKAIKDTYNAVKKEWSKDVQYFAEFIMVLNWKCWQHYYIDNHDYGRLYKDLYYKARDYALNHFKGEELKYLLNEID